MIEVITGFHPAGYKEYGHRFMDSFQQYWTKDFKLIPYIEESIKNKNERFIDEIDDLNKFFDDYGNNESVKGKVPQRNWKNKERVEGYSYRHDAYKFARIPFIIKHAMENCKTEYMLWIDGDTYAFDTIDKNFILGMMPDNKDCAYLGRKRTHTECGFLLFKVEKARAIIKRWANMYYTGTFRLQPEWHNSYLFDRVLESITTTDDVHPYNMTPNGTGHVWFQSKVGERIDHIKGFRRKELGYSPERYDLKRKYADEEGTLK